MTHSMDLADFEAGARSGRFPQVADFVPPTGTRDEARHDSHGFTVPASLTAVISRLVSAGA